MKRFLFYVFAVAGMALSLSSCHSDDDDSNEGDKASGVIDSDYLQVPDEPVSLSALPYEADAAVYEFGENDEGIESIELTADGQYIAKYRDGAMPRNSSRAYGSYGYFVGTFTKQDANTYVLDGLFTMIVVNDDEVIVGSGSAHLKVTVTRPAGTTDTVRLCRRWYPVSLHIYLRVGDKVFFNKASSDIGQLMYEFDKYMDPDDHDSLQECLDDVPEYILFTRNGRYMQYFPQDDDPCDWSRWRWTDDQGHMHTWDEGKGEPDDCYPTVEFSGNDMYFTIGMEAELELEDIKQDVCFKYQWRFSEKKQ